MNRKSAGGFTVIELMIVLTIVPVVTMVLAVGMTEYQRLYAGIGADQEMAGEARTVMKWIGRDLRQSNLVLEKAGPYATSAEGTLALVGPGGKGAVVWTAGNDGLKRIEFGEDLATPIAEQSFAAPGARLVLDYGGAPATARQVGVRVVCSRPLAEERREFELSGRFGLKGAAQ